MTFYIRRIAEFIKAPVTFFDADNLQREKTFDISDMPQRKKLNFCQNVRHILVHKRLKYCCPGSERDR